jgi:glycosyltransferase involved in cell wall biosynthesis
MLNVAFITTHFPPDYRFGGTVRTAEGLAAGLLRAGARVKLVATSPSRGGRPSLDGRVSRGESSMFTGACVRSFAMHRWAFAPGFASACLEALRGADAAYINGIGTFPNTLAAGLCTSLGVPFVQAVQGGFEPYRLRHHKLRKVAYYMALTLPLLRRAHAVHVTTESEADACRSMGVDCTFVTIPNGIFPGDYAVPPRRGVCDAKFPQLAGRKFILFAGRLSWEKGLDLLAGVWLGLSRARRDGCVLAVAGRADRGRYESIARRFFGEELGRSVHFLGHVSGEYLRALYAAAELFVLPSHSENFGNVALEALACGTPVVATTGAPWSVVEEKGFGRWVAPDAGAIAGAVEDMLSLGGGRLREMGRAGREYALANYSWYDLGRRLHGVLDEGTIRRPRR